MMRRWIGLLFAASTLAGCAASHLHQVPPGDRVQLPYDHAPHDWAQTEWWHVHADVQDVETGEPLHLFAGFVVERTDLDRAAGLPIAPLINPYHVAYVKLLSRGKSKTSARYNFPSLRRAGFWGDRLDLRQGGQRVAAEDGVVVLEGRAGRQRVRLRLTSTQPATLPGGGDEVEVVDGTRQLWYQEERMEVSGMWRDGSDVRWVEGTGFFKHQWGRLCDADIDGFEWFSADLPDGRSLVVVKIHEGDDLDAPGSMAWIADAGGTPEDLDAHAIDVTAVRGWTSPRSGATWPVAWTIRGEGLFLTVESTVKDQELTVFPAPFYAGPARMVGIVGDQPVDVTAFVEQVGAWRPALRPLYRSDPPPEAHAEVDR